MCGLVISPHYPIYFEQRPKTQPLTCGMRLAARKTQTVL